MAKEWHSQYLYLSLSVNPDRNVCLSVSSSPCSTDKPDACCCTSIHTTVQVAILCYVPRMHKQPDRLAGLTGGEILQTFFFKQSY